ncbi:hypothetical protein C8R47DRAFT_1078337 [Mycena vitilis]|nr:hypothetical protein C8R47DRAFT_1078337 [Mycena vitilis]
MHTSLIIAAVLASVVNASHRITLRNNCGRAMELKISSYPHAGTDYHGPAIPKIAAGASHVVTVPKGVRKRLLRRNRVRQSRLLDDRAPFDRCDQWTFNSAKINGHVDYDISNIQGFSVAQRIIPETACHSQKSGTVTCKSKTCPCNEAYRPGDTSGTCGGTGPVDQASRVCASSGYTVVLWNITVRGLLEGMEGKFQVERRPAGSTNRAEAHPALSGLRCCQLSIVRRKVRRGKGSRKPASRWRGGKGFEHDKHDLTPRRTGSLRNHVQAVKKAASAQPEPESNGISTKWCDAYHREWKADAHQAPPGLNCVGVRRNKPTKKMGFRSWECTSWQGANEDPDARP